MELSQKKVFKDLFTIPKTLQPSHLPTLNGIRGIAILMVIMSHLRLSTDGFYYKIFNGDLGVDLFFVLSGFLITTLCIKEKIATNNLSLRKFYIRRALRILPLAYLFLFVVEVLNLAFKLEIPTFQFLGAAFFILNLSYFRSHDLKAPIGHYWSLATEEQFYLIFPPLFKLSFRGFCLAILLIVVLLPVFCLIQEYLPSINNGILYAFTHVLIKFQGIAVGCLFSIIMFRYSGFAEIVSSYKLLFNSIAIVLIFFLPFNFFYTINAVFINLTISLLIGYVIISNLEPRTDLFYIIFNNKVISYIGVLSYSIYIWQQIFTMHQPWENLFRIANSKLLNILALAIVAFCSYQFFERRFLRFKKKFTVVATSLTTKEQEV